MNCKYLDHQLCIKTDGQYRFCCVSTEPSNVENIKTHTPIEWFESKAHKNAKELFSQGQWPAGCEVCRKKEELGLESKRTDRNVLGPEISHLDIRFGNSCNLKCVSCWEKSSSSIAEEAKTMSKQGIVPVYDVLDITNFNWASKKTIDQITDFPIKEVYLTGGEPMMVKHLPDLLERLSSDVIIRFNTNGTIYNDKLASMLKRFKLVNISFSLDAIGKRIEYIRYGSVWKTIEENYKKYRNTVKLLSISPTISVLNAAYLEELAEWADLNNLPIYYNFLDNPKHLHIKNAPVDLKNLFTRTQGWEVGDPDLSEIEKFKDIITRLDKFRNVRIKDYLPEVAQAYDLN